MKDLNVSSFEELKAYIEAPEHQDEEIVKQLKRSFRNLFRKIINYKRSIWKIGYLKY